MKLIFSALELKGCSPLVRKSLPSYRSDLDYCSSKRHPTRRRLLGRTPSPSCASGAGDLSPAILLPGITRPFKSRQPVHKYRATFQPKVGEFVFTFLKKQTAVTPWTLHTCVFEVMCAVSQVTVRSVWKVVCNEKRTHGVQLGKYAQVHAHTHMDTDRYTLKDAHVPVCLSTYRSVFLTTRERERERERGGGGGRAMRLFI